MRLIDADALDMYECLRSYYGDAWRDAQKAVDDAPTVDPIKHGHWVMSNGDYEWECSSCGCGLSNNRTAYCYDCGAKMDEGEDET